MGSSKLTSRINGVATWVAMLLLLSACTQTTDWLKGRKTADADDPVILGAPKVDIYLNELAELASGDPAAQAEIYADASSAATLTPDASTNLRLGLVLATPGHPESDPEAAQSLLREVLAQTPLLTTGEVSLATIYLNNVEKQIVVNNEARRLRDANSRAARTEEQAISQRLATVEAENRQLRQALQEAEDKLDAITSIERSIREQEE